MATLVHTDGTKEEIDAKNGKFDIQEISDILSDIVTPMFIGSWWIFKPYDSEGLEYNKVVSNMLGLKFYGNCLFCAEKELKEYFFFPQDLIRNMTIEFLLSNLSGLMNQDNFNEELIKLSVNDCYNSLFEIENVEEIYKTFISTKSYAGISTEEKINNLQRMLEYFEDNEEYEKCKNIKKLLNFIEKGEQ